MADLNERDAKLVQWLNEAHVKEAELEADLTAHIALTEKQSYKKRLQQHLKETRDHKRRVASRIKKLGGSATSGPDIPGVPAAVGEVAGKGVAAVKGQVGIARAAVTEQAETHLHNAQEELREEHVEIALYTRLEMFADEVGDRETAQLAKAIRRDEERMAKFLDAELKRLVKAVVRAEIPSDQRANGNRPGARSRGRSATSKRSGARRHSTAAPRARPRNRAAGREPPRAVTGPHLRSCHVDRRSGRKSLRSLAAIRASSVGCRPRGSPMGRRWLTSAATRSPWPHTLTHPAGGELAQREHARAALPVTHARERCLLDHAAELHAPSTSRWPRPRPRWRPSRTERPSPEAPGAQPGCSRRGGRQGTPHCRQRTRSLAAPAWGGRAAQRWPLPDR